MPNRNEKVLLTLAAAAGIGVTTFLLIKYRKNLITKLTNAKNIMVHDLIKVPRKLDIHIINNVNECEKILKIIKQHTEKYCVIGFDCEWVTVNSERRKVALLQLATAEGLCALFRLCKFSSIPQDLFSILEDPDIIKAGVASTEDAKLLLQDYAIKVNGAFDLRFLALLTNHKAEGLAKLSKKILDINLDKNWRITCSDWESSNLTPPQIDYAAKDAFVAIEIFKKLYSTLKRNSDDKFSILQLCDNYTDISFKNKLAQLNLDGASVETLSEKKLLKNQKDLNKVLKRAYTTRNRPLYDNCFLEAPDGALLSTIDKRKAEWYVKKGLGVEIEKEPLRVRLNFEPAGRAVGEVGEYYQSVKKNCCTVCGKDFDLIRKNVIPHEYRKYFPLVMKNKTSHDIVLLCTHCHHISNISDLKIRRMLEEKCNAPIIQLPDYDDEHRKFKTIRSSARALLKNKNLIPEARIKELSSVIEEEYPNKIIDDEFLKELLAQNEPEPIQKMISHGEIVVDYYAKNGGIVELEIVFRKHFLDTMNPQHLPSLWNINHNANRLTIRAQENRIDPEDLKIAGLIPSIQVIAPSSPEKTRKVDLIDENNVDNDNEDDDDEVDCVSVSSFYSAAGTVDNSSRKFNTDDEKYFSDSTTVGSYYESCANSVFDPTEFQSFDEMSDKIDNYSDSSTIGSDHSDFSQEDDTDTEVDDLQAKK